MSEKGTEAATPQRKKKARETGDGVRSRDLVSAASMLAGIVVLGTMAGPMVSSWGRAYQQSLQAAEVGELSGLQWMEAVRRMLASVVLPVGMVMTASFVTALATGVLQGGGLTIHPAALGLKLSRLNPVTNAANLFSLRSATRIVKSLVPAGVMVALGWTALRGLMVTMPVMSLARLPSTFSTAYTLSLDAAVVTLLWSALDYGMEWRSWNQRLRMTKDAIREEVKESMGNPQVKQRVRQIQRAMRKRKVKADLSRASVVITNPTHYAVALEFSFETMHAPTVLAKGRDLHAAEIREEARWLGIPMIENAPLARSLYKSVEPGHTIPFDLYAAVAGILAYLYRQKVEEKMRQSRDARQAETAYRNPAAARGFDTDSRSFGGGI